MTVDAGTAIVKILPVNVGSIGKSIVKETAIGQKSLTSLFVKAEGGLTSVGKTAGIAGGAIVAALSIGKVAFGFAQSFADATAAVRKLQLATGDTAQDASKLAFASKALGIDTDVAAKGFFRLNSKILSGKANLAAYGIEVAHNHDGTVNFAATLVNTADAFHKMDAGARSAAVAQLLGARAGATLLPILSKSRKELTALFDEAAKDKQIFSQDDLNKGRLFSIQMRELGLATQGFGVEIGKIVVGPLTEFTHALTDVVQLGLKASDALGSIDLGGLALDAVPVLGPTLKLGRDLFDVFGGGSDAADKFEKAQERVAAATDKVKAAVNDGTISTRAGKKAQSELSAAVEHQSKLEDTLAAAAGQTTNAEKRHAEAAAELKRNIQSLSDTLFSAADAERGVATAQLDAADAQQRAKDAQVALNEARAGGNPDAIAQAERDLQRAMIDAAAATDKESQAAFAATQTQGAFNEVAANPKARDEVIRRLVAAQQAYPQVAALIQTEIDKINAIPPTRHTDITANTAQAVGAIDAIGTAADRAAQKLFGLRGQFGLFPAAGKSVLFTQPPGHAFGGAVRANEPITVGENGTEVFVPHQDGRIVPHNQLRSSKGGTHVENLTINAWNAREAMNELASELAWREAIGANN